mmetsp:Transcript_17347/g.58604  ORF Transcript_17347/g.58604 Transcript_17347/m.58604 type:complete len:203 (+) Transcript_17347:1095-1703(+)
MPHRHLDPPRRNPNAGALPRKGGLLLSLLHRRRDVGLRRAICRARRVALARVGAAQSFHGARARHRPVVASRPTLPLHAAPDIERTFSLPLGDDEAALSADLGQMERRACVRGGARGRRRRRLRRAARGGVRGGGRAGGHAVVCCHFWRPRPRRRFARALRGQRRFRGAARPPPQARAGGAGDAPRAARRPGAAAVGGDGAH